MAQPTPQQARELLAALREKLTPDVAQAFFDAVQAVAQGVDIGQLTDLIKAGRVEEAVRMINHLRALYFPFADQLRQAYVQGGMFAAAAVPLLRNPLNGTRFVFAFDGRHSRAQAWAEVRAAEFLTNVQAEQILAARAVIVDGIATNRPPADVARDLVGKLNRLTGLREGGVIGLTSPQTETYLRTRADLYRGDEAGLRRYLSLASRNKTYDAWANDALGGTPLGKDKIEKMLAGQKSKMLGQRGETVARNETFSALSAGQHEGWQQLVETGAVKAADITKRWQHNHNIPFRPDHQAMSGTVVTFDQPFLVSGARMMHDHDPAGGPKNNIGCHCTTFYRLRKGRGSDG